jgi:glycosyltransferase involved in cell wall biosynthesis
MKPANSTVRFLGPRDDVPAILHAADLYVTASTAEGLGIANLEAMASGLPVVCRHLPGITDDMQHGAAVTSLTKWTPAVFAEAVCHLTDPTVLSQARQDAEHAIRTRFDLAGRLRRIALLTSVVGAP